MLPSCIWHRSPPSRSFSMPQGHPTCTRVSSTNFKIQCTLLYLLLYSTMALDQHTFPVTLGTPVLSAFTMMLIVTPSNVLMPVPSQCWSGMLTTSKLLTHLPLSPCSVQLQHPNSQFLQHVDHRLVHHSQILQYLFIHEADERSVHEPN